MNPPDKMNPLNVIDPHQPGSRLVTLLCRELTSVGWGQLAQLTDADWRQVVTLAKEHMVASLLYSRVLQHGLERTIPTAELERLEYIQHRTALSNLRLYHQLEQIITRAKEQQIVVMLLKGAHLAATVYPAIDQRVLTDLELLVKQEQVPAIVELLLELGYKPSTPLIDMENYVAGKSHQLPRFLKPHAPDIALHWSLQDQNEAQSLDMAEIWERAQILSIQGESVVGLSSEDLLIHIALHATNYHLLRQGVRFLCDVDSIVRYHQALEGQITPSELNWTVVMERAKRYGGERALFLVLILADQLLGTPIPASIYHILGNHPINELTWQGILEQLFVDNRSSSYDLSYNSQQIPTQPAEAANGHYLWHQLLASRQQLVSNYQLSANSLWRPSYYTNRFRDLVTRHLTTRYRMKRAEPLMRDIPLQQLTIARWLEGAN